MSRRVYLILLALVSALYLFLRLYSLPTRLDFRLDQAIHLSEAKSLVDQRQLRLVGPMVTSQNLNGRHFFIGPNYYYLLAVAGMLTSWDPLWVIVFFIILEFLFYLIFISFLRQKFGAFVSLTTFLFLSLSPYLVAHSRFFWNPHLLIPLSILAIVWLNKYIDTHKYVFLFLAGIAWGFAFSAHYLALLWLPIFLYFLHKNDQLFHPSSYFFLVSGFLLGDLPFFIFELRHQFYNLQTFLAVYSHPGSGVGLTSHYFVFPLLIFAIYFLLSTFYLRPLLVSSFLLLVILFQFYLYPNYPSFGTVLGWDYPTQLKVASKISQNCPKNFNVATTMQGDTRASDLRYLLSLRGCQSQSVDAYPSSQNLILVAPHSRPPQEETVWEVSSLRPFTVVSAESLNSFLDLYLLRRI